MEARVTAHSQAFQLRERMKRADVQHGQEIRADLPGIRVSAMARPWLGEHPLAPGGEVALEVRDEVARRGAEGTVGGMEHDFLVGGVPR